MKTGCQCVLFAIFLAQSFWRRWQPTAGAEALVIVLGTAAVAFGILAVIKKRFAAKASAWPTVPARIENVFINISPRGPNRRDETHAVLAYAYSVADSYCSGQITLWAGEESLEALEKEMIGREVRVHWNPDQSDESIFLGEDVRGWDVLKDRRISVWWWLQIS